MGKSKNQRKRLITNGAPTRADKAPTLVDKTTALVGETGTLPEVLRRQMSLLRNRRDKPMRKFKKGSPEFYADYRRARVIVDRGGNGGGGSSTPPPTPPPANP